MIAASDRALHREYAMRSIRCSTPHLLLALFCAGVVALAGFARVQAAPLGHRPDRRRLGDRSPRRPSRASGSPRSCRRAGAAWAGAEERGLARLDRGEWRTIGPRTGLPDSRVVALFQDHQQRLWVSTGGGLGYLPADGGPFRRIGLSGLPALPVLAFGQAADGSILLGSARGLSVWQADGGLESVSSLVGVPVLALHTDRAGETWAGTSAGLWRRSGGSWQRVMAVGDGPVAAIAESPEGRLYAGGRRRSGSCMTGRGGALAAPAAGPISAVAERDGTVWLGTPQGVVAGQAGVWEAYDPGRLPQAAVTSLAWSGDVLWVGTTGGLVAYRPDAAAPHVSIASVNGRQPDAGGLSLSSDRVGNIAIEAGDGATPQGRLHVFTRLDGVDGEPRLLAPSERGDLGAISVYAGRALPPGSHVLRVWVQDDAFNRSAEAQVTIHVPELAHGPAGLAVRRDAAYAGVAGMALVLTAGMTTAAAQRVRRRRAEYAAQAAGGQARSAAGRRARELYSTPAPVREQELAEAAAALKRKNLLVLGEPGMGKTSTAWQVGGLLARLSGAGRWRSRQPLSISP